MSAKSLSVSSDISEGMKLIRFFKVVGFLGGFVWLIRAMIGIAIVGGIVFALNGLLS